MDFWWIEEIRAWLGRGDNTNDAGAADYLQSAYLLNKSGKKTSGFVSDSIYKPML